MLVQLHRVPGQSLQAVGFASENLWAQGQSWGMNLGSRTSVHLPPVTLSHVRLCGSWCVSPSREAKSVWFAPFGNERKSWAYCLGKRNLIESHRSAEMQFHIYERSRFRFQPGWHVFEPSLLVFPGVGGGGAVDIKPAYGAIT